jgi:hypothetical protein
MIRSANHRVEMIGSVAILRKFTRFRGHGYNVLICFWISLGESGDHWPHSTAEALGTAYVITSKPTVTISRRASVGVDQ